jgi:hypothetical protein
LPPFGYFFGGAEVHNAAHYSKESGYDFSETCRLMNQVEIRLIRFFFNLQDMPLDPGLTGFTRSDIRKNNTNVKPIKIPGVKARYSM